MTIAAIEWAFTQQIEIPSAKLVLLALADHANDKGHCWPSMERLQDRTGLSRATVYRAIDTLTGIGLVQMVKRGRANNYNLAMSQDEIGKSQDEIGRSHSEIKMRHGETLTVKKRHNEPSLKRARASAVPLDWFPDDELIEWAKERTPHVDTDIETERFINYYASKGELRKDWRASWRNWMLRAIRDYSPKLGHIRTRMDGQRQRNDERIGEAMARRTRVESPEGVEPKPQLRLIEGGAASH